MNLVLWLTDSKAFWLNTAVWGFGQVRSVVFGLRNHSRQLRHGITGMQMRFECPNLILWSLLNTLVKYITLVAADPVATFAYLQKFQFLRHWFVKMCPHNLNNISKQTFHILPNSTLHIFPPRTKRFKGPLSRRWLIKLRHWPSRSDLVRYNPVLFTCFECFSTYDTTRQASRLHRWLLVQQWKTWPGAQDGCRRRICLGIQYCTMK